MYNETSSGDNNNGDHGRKLSEPGEAAGIKWGEGDKEGLDSDCQSIGGPERFRPHYNTGREKKGDNLFKEGISPEGAPFTVKFSHQGSVYSSVLKKQTVCLFALKSTYKNHFLQAENNQIWLFCLNANLSDDRCIGAPLPRFVYSFMLCMHLGRRMPELSVEHEAIDAETGWGRHT